MPGWDRSRNTIGQNRTWIIGRALGGLWFLGAAVHALWLGLLVRLVYAVIDGVFTLIFNRQIQWGQTWSAVLFRYGIAWGKYPLGLTPYPGLIPRRSMGER